ncbi:hypothetical protein ABE10_12725, partial [Bacillus toyonensis]|nr:hypothetical protein [Bacillus toyonensis]
LEEDVPHGVEPLVPEVPDTGERGEAVVEADQHAEGEDRVPQRVLADEAHDRVEDARDDRGDDRGVAGAEEARVHAAEPLRQRAVVAHREQRPRRRGERRLERGGGAGEHGERDEEAERAHDRVRQGEEDVLLDVRVAQAERSLSDAGEHDHGDGEQQVEEDNREHDDGRRTSRRLLRVLRLLVHREGQVPAPEDEDRQGEPCHRGGEGRDRERVEPVGVERGRVEGVARGGPHDRRDREDDEDDDLEADQPVLQLLGGAQVAVRDPGRGDHEREADGHVDERVARELGDVAVAGDLTDEQEEEVDRDAREVGEDEDRRRDEPPARHPSDPRAEGPGRPREGGPGVRHHAVELAVPEGDEQHRDETDE